jgi:hypothetical protein
MEKAVAVHPRPTGRAEAWLAGAAGTAACFLIAKGIARL